MKIKILTLKKNNIEDFAKERNNLLNESNSEWNLFIDTDEKLDINRLAMHKTQYTSYYLTRKNYFLNQYVGSEKIIRLMKKGTGIWIRKVHEYWQTNIGHIGSVPINNYIIHNTANNLNDYLVKINYYSDLHAKENKREGKKSNLFKIVVCPIGKFFITYFKSRNVVFSIMQSLHSFLSWSKLLLYYS